MNSSADAFFWMTLYLINKLLPCRRADVTHANEKWTGDFFFQNANSQPYFINQGDTNPKRRSEIVETFNSSTPSSSSSSPLVLLLSLRAGGVGLNLVGANHLFLLDLHWNPALEAQAVDRIYRVGQTKPVFVHKFICKVEIYMGYLWWRCKEERISMCW